MSEKQSRDSHLHDRDPMSDEEIIDAYLKEGDTFSQAHMRLVQDRQIQQDLRAQWRNERYNDLIIEGYDPDNAARTVHEEEIADHYRKASEEGGNGENAADNSAYEGEQDKPFETYDDWQEFREIDTLYELAGVRYGGHAGNVQLDIQKQQATEAELYKLLQTFGLGIPRTYAEEMVVWERIQDMYSKARRPSYREEAASNKSNNASHDARENVVFDEELIEATVNPDHTTVASSILPQDDTWSAREVKIGGTTTRIELTEAERIFASVDIRGDGHAGKLTHKLIEESGLLPHHRLETEKRTVWFSHGYDIGGGRIAMLGYVQDDDGSIIARSYYRSNSQGTWRYLPQYMMRDAKISWYSKGYGEDSLTLPAVLQEGLARAIEDDGGILELNAKAAQTAFIGTARYAGSEGTAYHRNVADTSRSLTGIPARDEHGNLPSPERVRLTPDQSPNFQEELANWQQDTPLYGNVTYQVFPSSDRRLRYTFCYDQEGRAWISNVEDDTSPIESTGLRQRWISDGALTTPAYEYNSQAGGYGGGFDRSGKYVDMFQNYLSKIPVIQEYTSHVFSSK